MVPASFAVALDMEVESKRVKDSFKVFDMSNSEDGIDIFLERVLTSEETLEEKN